MVGFGVRSGDALFRFRFGDGLHVGGAVVMGCEHDVGGSVGGEVEDGGEDIYDEVHRGHIIVVDDDAVERFELSFAFFEDFDFREGVKLYHLAGVCCVSAKALI